VRAALVFLAFFVAVPALAQDGKGSLDVQTINGVRVWRPKPSPAPAERQTAPPPTTVIVINNLPSPEPLANEVVGLAIGAPFFYKPFGGPFLPHLTVRLPEIRQMTGMQK